MSQDKLEPSAPPVVTLSIAPRLDSGPTVLVRVVVRGAPATSPTWHIVQAKRAAVSELTAEDESGTLPVVARDTPPSVELTFGRKVKGELTLSYRVAAEAFSSDVLGVALDPNHMRVSGERLVALPDGIGETPVDALVRIDPTALGPYARAASSFGIGNKHRLQASPSALRRATYLAGPMGQALLDGPEGHDEVAWLGYTTFDPRSVAAEVAGFRMAARDFFRERDSAPFTLLIVVDPRPVGEFEATRRTSSVLLHVGVNQAYNGPLRVTVAHQLLREWMGSVLYVGPLDPRKSGEAIWFTDGVTRYLGRELTFRFGLLTAAEYVAEVEELERIALTSPLAEKSNAELAALGTPAASALAVARGARHAADVDARIRKKSGGKRSLDDLMRQLYAEAKRVGGPLLEKAWLDALTDELPSAGPASFAHVATGKRLELPADALGRCFAAEARRYERFALGFELDGDGSKFPEKVASVTPAGPAERAGLRPGDSVLSIRQRPGDPSVPVLLSVERAGKPVPIEYRPVGAVVVGTGFRRIGKLS